MNSSQNFNVDSGVTNVNATNQFNNGYSQNDNFSRYNEMNINYNQVIDNIPKPKKNMNIIFIILGVLVALGIALFVFFTANKNMDKSTTDSKAILDPNRPIIVSKDKKYGYINSEGKTILEPQYKNAGEFLGNYAIVTVDNPDPNSYNKVLYQVIDKTGNVKILPKSYSAPENYPAYGIWVIDRTLYDSKLNKVLSNDVKVSYLNKGFLEFEDTSNNESGIINFKGEVIFSWEGSNIVADISDIDETEEDLYASLSMLDEREVIVSIKTGKVLFTLDDVKNKYIAEEENNIFKIINRNGNYETEKFMYFRDGKLAYEISNIEDLEVEDYKNQILELDYGDDYAELGKTKRYAYYDLKSQKLLNVKPSFPNLNDDYSALEEIVYGFKKYNCSSKNGLMSGNEIIIPCEYDNIDFINSSLYQYIKHEKGQELVFLEKDKKTILMDLKIKTKVVDFNSTSIYDYDNSTFLKIILYKDNNYTQTGMVFYNLLTNKTITFENDDHVSVYSNYITVEKDNKKIYYNTKLNQIYVGEI